MNNLYLKAFKGTLQESIDNDLERSAMEDGLDSDVSADEFDVDMTEPEAVDGMDPDAQIADAMSKKNEMMVQELDGWISKTEDFLTFLNGEGPNSVQSKLAAAESDTIMDKMKQSQQTKISRVASDLASLHQNFLGFKAQTSNPKYKFV